ncbi:MAG: hypothetical protein MJY69_00700 [Bacteroidales bacterium]|nr:hypothetical protein [Bacteroidales bacterium]
MDKIISEICSHITFRKTRLKSTVYNLIGFLVVNILFVCAIYFFDNLRKYPQVIGAETNIDFFKRFYTIDKIIGLIICLISLYLLIFALKYGLSLLIESIKILRLPKFNDLNNSIQVLMTPLVDDDFGLHYEILKYLHKNKTAKDFALVHLWLFENSCIYTKEQKAFLDALSTDVKIISVPAPSTFNSAEIEVSAWLKKEEDNLSPEAYFYVKHYKELDKILGIYKIKD